MHFCRACIKRRAATCGNTLQSFGKMSKTPGAKQRDDVMEPGKTNSLRLPVDGIHIYESEDRKRKCNYSSCNMQRLVMFHLHHKRFSVSFPFLEVRGLSNLAQFTKLLDASLCKYTLRVSNLNAVMFASVAANWFVNT